MKRNEFLKKLEDRFKKRFNVWNHIANTEARWILDTVEELGMEPPVIKSCNCSGPICDCGGNYHSWEFDDEKN